VNHYNVLGKFFVAPSDSQEISKLLKAWGNSNQAALDRLTPLVYAELHRMARRHMRKERENTLQTTALVTAHPGRMDSDFHGDAGPP
jgi:hypothetical protein